MDKKISIVMAYYNRKTLLYNTLKIIEKTKHKDNLEIVIVDDASNEDQRLDELIDEIELDIKLIKVEQKDKTWTNPCIPYNIGFKHASNEIIIIQNPECIHYGDVIGYVLDNIEENKYLNFACYSVDNKITNTFNRFDFNHANVSSKIGKLISPLAKRGVRIDGESAWYNHSVLSPHMLHFCSAIMKSDLEDLGGFDERYANGIAYDDNEFLERIKRKNMAIQIIDRPFVIHQYHGNTDYGGKRLLVQKNQQLFNNVTLKETDYKVNKK